MTERYPYRFKTEEEFTRDFGENWRYQINWHTGGRMDYLIGKPYPFFVKKGTNIGYLFNGLPMFNKWTIDWSMLTENKPKVPNYKPRKIIRYI